DGPGVLQDGAAEPLGGPQRRRARLPLGHAVDRSALRADPPDPRALRRPDDAERGPRGPRAPAAHRTRARARRSAPPRRPEARPARRVVGRSPQVAWGPPRGGSPAPPPRPTIRLAR